MTEDMDTLRRQLTKAIKKQAARPVCKCGHPDNLHSFDSPARDWCLCRAMGCECERYAVKKG